LRYSSFTFHVTVWKHLKKRAQFCFLSVFKRGLSLQAVYWLIPVHMKLGFCHCSIHCNITPLQLHRWDLQFWRKDPYRQYPCINECL